MMSTGPFELQQFLDSVKFGRYLQPQVADI